MSFFSDFTTLTLVQHLIKYWMFWGLFVAGCFAILFSINKRA